MSLDFFEHLTILYAEDEEGVRSSVKQTLELFFSKVIEASNGEKALELFYEHKPDILLLDICMPKCDGLSMLKEIRKSHKRIPVIIMSAHAEQTYFLQAIDLNICKYLLKPFSKSSFTEALRACAEWMYEWDDRGVIKVMEGITYNPQTYTLVWENQSSILTKKERILFEYFLRQKNRVIPFEELEYLVWDNGEGSKEALKALIKELRKKLPKELIENSFGTGYKLVVS